MIKSFNLDEESIKKLDAVSKILNKSKSQVIEKLIKENWTDEEAQEKIEEIQQRIEEIKKITS